MTDLSLDQQADALEALAAAIRAGHPADDFRVSTDGATVISRNFMEAARWRERFGDEIAGAPLHVQHLGRPFDVLPGRST